MRCQIDADVNVIGDLVSPVIDSSSATPALCEVSLWTAIPHYGHTRSYEMRSVGNVYWPIQI